ncbi:universal stress protein [Natrialbaceae archaeon A-arb3/5]
MAERILVGYDGSELAASALAFAFETAPDAEVTALHVIQVPDGLLPAFEGPEIQLPVTEKAHEHAESILDEARDIASEHGRELETAIATGKPDQRIVERAADGDYDMVVVGSHGRSGLSRVLLGSVAETVVRRAPVSVAVVR